MINHSACLGQGKEEAAACQSAERRAMPRAVFSAAAASGWGGRKRVSASALPCKAAVASVPTHTPHYSRCPSVLQSPGSYGHSPPQMNALHRPIIHWSSCGLPTFRLNPLHPFAPHSITHQGSCPSCPMKPPLPAALRSITHQEATMPPLEQTPCSTPQGSCGLPTFRLNPLPLLPFAPLLTRWAVARLSSGANEANTCGVAQYRPTGVRESARSYDHHAFGLPATSLEALHTALYHFFTSIQVPLEERVTASAPLTHH